MNLPLLPACLACGAGELTPLETITAVELADAWRRDDCASGASRIGDRRAEDLLRMLPERIRFDRCGRCGLEIATPPAVWSAETYPTDQSYPARWEFLRCATELGPERLDVLELGCGSGEFLSLAAANGHRAVGIDFSATAVDKARARGLRAFCGGIDELERHVGTEARFDAVVLFHVIEHLPDPDALLTALVRWIQPRARLFLSCPGPQRFTRLIRDQQAGCSDFWDYPPQHVLRWTLPALDAILTRRGWRVLSAVEEPLSWRGATSQIGVTHAMYRGKLANPLARRVSIVAGFLRLLTAPRTRRAGISLYLSAIRDEQNLP